MQWVEEREDGEIIHQIPYRWEICSVCSGEGKHSGHLGGFTQSEWREWDYESRIAYRQGAFDKRCDDCSGTGKVQVTDWEVLEENDPELCSRYRQYLVDEDYFARIQAAERRMGA